MAASKLPWLVLASAFATGALGMVACKTEGPSAPARKNGCIDTGCGSVTTAAPPSSSTDAGTTTKSVPLEMGDEDDDATAVDETSGDTDASDGRGLL